MKIGFIKFGLKTYFNRNGTGQGSNHELVDVFNIFKERGHECIMLSNTDLDTPFDTSDIDYVFVFNGPLCKGFESKMNMFQGTCQALNYLKMSKVPWLYFWTDPRPDYDIRNHEIYKINPPINILSQEKEFYGHLEKLVLYRKQIDSLLPRKKSVTLGILMNYTDPKRSKKLLSDLNWVKEYNPKIYGNWKNEKNPFLEDKVDEGGLRFHLDGIKYSYNIGKNPKWVSQKYYEMILSDVLCFYANYDEDNLIMEKNDFRRVIDGIDLYDKLHQMQHTQSLFNIYRKQQYSELKTEYLNGDFIYNIIRRKISY